MYCKFISIMALTCFLTFVDVELILTALIEINTFCVLNLSFSFCGSFINLSSLCHHLIFEA